MTPIKKGPKVIQKKIRQQKREEKDRSTITCVTGRL